VPSLAGGLHQLLRTEPRHLLQDYPQLLIRSKHLVDVATDARYRRIGAGGMPTG